MASSLSLLEKHDEILVNERQLAGHVALDVVDRPLLALWMILIPVFFVIYFFQYRRYKNGLRDFVDNFLITRKRVLEATYDSLYSGDTIDIEELMKISDSPAETRDDYRGWVEALIDYYQVLLTAEGSSFEGLVRSSHKNRSNFLSSLNKLTGAERSFDKALMSTFTDEEGTYKRVVEDMEKSIESFRRAQAEKIFP